MIFYHTGNSLSPSKRILSSADQRPAGQAGIPTDCISLQIIQYLGIFRIQTAHRYCMLRPQKMRKRMGRLKTFCFEFPKMQSGTKHSQTVQCRHAIRQHIQLISKQDQLFPYRPLTAHILLPSGTF